MPLNAFLNKLSSSAADAGSFAKGLVESGVRSVSEAFRGIPLFRSLDAHASADLERDETHYLLVPVGEGAYSIYVKRALPPDVGASNSLPKARLFHLPDSAAREELERKLVEMLAGEKGDEGGGESEFGDTLEGLADQFDKAADEISGGLLVIGGMVAIANPLLGVGIAAKALLPQIGTKAAKSGAGLVASKLRDRNAAKAAAKAGREAEKEVEKLKPQLFTNPLLRRLEIELTNPDAAVDPALDHRAWPDQFPAARHYEITVEAIREVYADALGAGMASGGDRHLAWLEEVVATGGR